MVSDGKGSRVRQNFSLGTGKTGPTVSVSFSSLHVKPDAFITLSITANCTGFYQIYSNGTGAEVFNFSNDTFYYSYSENKTVQLKIAGPEYFSTADLYMSPKEPYLNTTYYKFVIIFRDGLYQSDSLIQDIYVDETPPSSVSSITYGDDNIPLTKNITYTFDEEMDFNSFNQNNIQITPSAGISFVSYDADDKKAVYALSGLVKCKNYTLKLNGVKDLAGNEISEQTVEFKTIPYTVMFDLNGANIGDSSVSPKSGYSIDLPGKESCFLLKKDGEAYYGFKGWSAEKNGSLITNPYSPLYDNQILYAVWGDLAVGDRGPAGGWIFIANSSVQNSPGGEWKYMEAAPKEYECTGIAWCPAGNTLVALSTNENIGDGISNTRNICNAMSGQGNYAAKYPSTLPSLGSAYSDWFLPSLYEAIEMTQKLYGITCCGIGETLEYWTSSYSSDTFAYVAGYRLTTGNGAITNYYRQYIDQNRQSIRPCRRFK